MEEQSAFLDPSLSRQEISLADVDYTTFPLTTEMWDFPDMAALNYPPQNSDAFSLSDGFVTPDILSLSPETDMAASPAMTPDTLDWDTVLQDFPETEFDAPIDTAVVRRPKSNRPNRPRRTSSEKSSKQSHQPYSRKRSHSDKEDPDTDSYSGPTLKATKLKAHCAVERKYRSNLCSRFNELKECLPSLRGTTDRSSSGSDCGSDPNSTSDVGPSVTKATILATAVEYILEIQKQNARIRAEREEWKSRFQAFEKLILQQRAVAY
jgi:hypothetical protein